MTEAPADSAAATIDTDVVGEWLRRLGRDEPVNPFVLDRVRARAVALTGLLKQCKGKPDQTARRLLGELRAELEQLDTDQPSFAEELGQRLIQLRRAVDRACDEKKVAEEFHEVLSAQLKGLLERYAEKLDMAAARAELLACERVFESTMKLYEAKNGVARLAYTRF